MTRDEFRAGLGKRLRAAREAAKLSLADVGEAVGTSRQTMHNYETGAKEPGAWVLSRLVPVLKTDAGKLLNDGDD